MPSGVCRGVRSFSWDAAMRQLRADDLLPAASYADLVDAAERGSEAVRRCMAGLCDACGVDADDVATFDGVPIPKLYEKGVFKVLSEAPLKDRLSCERACADECAGDWSRVVDVLRIALVLTSEEEVMAAVHQLQVRAVPLDRLNTDPPEAKRADAPPFVVLRLRNRVAKPLFSGYRDLLVSLAVHVSGRFWACCELQVCVCVHVQSWSAHTLHDAPKSGGTHHARSQSAVCPTSVCARGGRAPPLLLETASC